MPPKGYAQRIENRAGGGVPDVHCMLNGLPFWLELKVANKFIVKHSPHQIAWHTSYAARGGLSFFLINSLSSKQIHLIEGREAMSVAQAPSFEGLGRSFSGICEPCGSVGEPCGSVAGFLLSSAALSRFSASEERGQETVCASALNFFL
jgi:hypothetical protein